jgi:chromosome partitioning protein
VSNVTTTIAVGNHKGGVAKTTSCLTLGACLANLGHHTLIVDLDSQSHLTMAVGLDADALPFSIADLLEFEEQPPPLDDVILSTMVSGLDILPADVRLSQFEHRVREHPGYETALVELFSRLGETYAYIVLDCPPSLGGMTLMALTAADYVLIPTQCDYFATKGLLRLLDLVDIVKERSNQYLGFYIFVVMYDGRTLVSQRILEQLRSRFPENLLDTLIGLDTRLRECAIIGEPVVSYAPKTRASLQYQNLTAEILARIQQRGK